MEIDQLADDTQQEECWHKTDDVADVDEIDETSCSRGKHWHFARDCHVETVRGWTRRFRTDATMGRRTTRTTSTRTTTKNTHATKACCNGDVKDACDKCCSRGERMDNSGRDDTFQDGLSIIPIWHSDLKLLSGCCSRSTRRWTKRNLSRRKKWTSIKFTMRKWLVTEWLRGTSSRRATSTDPTSLRPCSNPKWMLVRMVMTDGRVKEFWRTGRDYVFARRTKLILLHKAFKNNVCTSSRFGALSEVQSRCSVTWCSCFSTVLCSLFCTQIPFWSDLSEMCSPDCRLTLCFMMLDPRYRHLMDIMCIFDSQKVRSIFFSYVTFHSLPVIVEYDTFLLSVF